MSTVEISTIIAMATDPIYVGTGGFTIGRVDNTIVRDPITRIPKIPGSSMAGTWRYYVALELQSRFKDEYKQDRRKREEKKENIQELFNAPKEWMKNFNGNRFSAIRCAGQDDEAESTLEESKEKSGHCGHCIVCKSFGFSKKDLSNQGMLFFSDLNILFFPVYTRLGTKWITSPMLLQETISTLQENKILTFQGNEQHLNLGWLNLEVSGKHNISDVKKYKLEAKNIIIVPDSLISQIINSNLEVRTSVSIDPITGAAKDGALFTSEAIPRGTIFCGEVRAFAREGGNSLPELGDIWSALNDSKQYYQSLGIGGMTTRGFGRMEILGELNGKS